jgi:hypothetical protein
MGNSQSPHFSRNATRLEVAQLVSMKTRDQADVFSGIHDLYARLSLKEFSLTKDINKFGIYLPLFFSVLHCRNLVFYHILCLFSLSFTLWYCVSPTKCRNNLYLALK